LIDTCLKVRKAAADSLNLDTSRKFQIISNNFNDLSKLKAFERLSNIF
jgi:hypothetical protein